MCLKAGCVLRHKSSSDSQEWHVALKLHAGVTSLKHGRVYLEISQCFMHHCLKAGTPHRATHTSIILLCQSRFWTTGLLVRPVDDSAIKVFGAVGVGSSVMFWSLKKKGWYLTEIFSSDKMIRGFQHCHRFILCTPGFKAVLYLDVSVGFGFHYLFFARWDHKKKSPHTTYTLRATKYNDAHVCVKLPGNAFSIILVAFSLKRHVPHLIKIKLSRAVYIHRHLEDRKALGLRLRPKCIAMCAEPCGLSLPWRRDKPASGTVWFVTTEF